VLNSHLLPLILIIFSYSHFLFRIEYFFISKKNKDKPSSTEDASSTDRDKPNNESLSDLHNDPISYDTNTTFPPVSFDNKKKDVHPLPSVSSSRTRYGLKENGLIKKTFSMMADGIQYHLISYYYRDDVTNGYLCTPSSLPQFKSVIISDDLKSVIRTKRLSTGSLFASDEEATSPFSANSFRRASLGSSRGSPYDYPSSIAGSFRSTSEKRIKLSSKYRDVPDNDSDIASEESQSSYSAVSSARNSITSYFSPIGTRESFPSDDSNYCPPHLINHHQLSSPIDTVFTDNLILNDMNPIPLHDNNHSNISSDFDNTYINNNTPNILPHSPNIPSIPTYLPNDPHLYSNFSHSSMHSMSNGNNGDNLARSSVLPMSNDNGDHPLKYNYNHHIPHFMNNFDHTTPNLQTFQMTPPAQQPFFDISQESHQEILHDSDGTDILRGVIGNDMVAQITLARSSVANSLMDQHSTQPLDSSYESGYLYQILNDVNHSNHNGSGSH